MLSSARLSPARRRFGAVAGSSRSTSSCSIRRTTASGDARRSRGVERAARAGRPGRARARATRAGAGRRRTPRADARRRVRRQRADVLRMTAPDAMSTLAVYPGLVRSADQRPRRHHLARRAAVRPHHRRDPGERREGAAVHDGRAGRDRPRRCSRTHRTSRSTRSTGCWSTTSSGAQAQVIVRGLRAVSDFEFEFQMALMNQRLNAEDRDRVHDAGRAVHLHQLAADQGSVLARRTRRRPGAASSSSSGCARKAGVKRTAR